MAWSAPPTFTAGNVLTAAQLNILTADLNETAPAKATTAGQHFVATGANAIAARLTTTATVAPAETTTSATYTTLATAGPAVTVTTGASVLVMLHAKIINNTATANSFMGYNVSGASTVGESDGTALAFAAGAASVWQQVGTVIHHSGLTPGSNTFTCMYRVNTGTGTFQNRRITVFPL